MLLRGDCHEPIVVARKPLVGTVAANVLEYGTGALNIDGTRVGTEGGTARDGKATKPNDSGWTNMKGHDIQQLNAGRWPANTIITHSPDCAEVCAEGCPVLELDRQSGVSKSGTGAIRKEKPGLFGLGGDGQRNVEYGDTGGASRFFTQTAYGEADTSISQPEGDLPMLLRGDCLELIKTLPDNSVDSIVSDPPYELSFMGKGWDGSGIAYSVELWQECLRVLKPGGHLLAFGGTRTYHRMAVAIEDAGFEIRDSIHWTYGSGFPKSLDVSKAIEGTLTTGSSNKKDFRHLDGEQVNRGNWGIAKQQQTHGQRATNYDETAGETRLGKLIPSTPEAQQWQGWGTALKPSHEPIVLARKPLAGTVAANVLEYGTGALNIDGTRVAGAPRTTHADGSRVTAGNGYGGGWKPMEQTVPEGRWPANTVITHSPDCDEACAEGCPAAALDEQSGVSKSPKQYTKTKAGWLPPTLEHRINDLQSVEYGDTGGASRFFTQTTYTEADTPAFLYYAKASKRERDAGLSEMPEQDWVQWQTGNGASGKPSSMSEGRNTTRRNTHPTVKPVELMRHLVRLVTPKGGTVFDPFLGSGTTAVAAVLEGCEWIGCEMTEDYWPIIEGRVAWALSEAESIAPSTTEETLF